MGCDIHLYLEKKEFGYGKDMDMDNHELADKLEKVIELFVELQTEYNQQIEVKYQSDLVQKIQSIDESIETVSQVQDYLRELN